MAKISNGAFYTFKFIMIAVAIFLFPIMKFTGAFFDGSLTMVYRTFKTELGQMAIMYLMPLLNLVEAALALLSFSIYDKNGSACKKIQGFMDLKTYSNILSLFNIINVTAIPVSFVILIKIFEDFG